MKFIWFDEKFGDGFVTKDIRPGDAAEKFVEYWARDARKKLNGYKKREKIDLVAWQADSSSDNGNGSGSGSGSGRRDN